MTSMSHVVVSGAASANKTSTGPPKSTKLQLARSAARGPVISLAAIISSASKSNKSAVKRKIRLKTSNNSSVSRQSSVVTTLHSEKSEITKNSQQCFKSAGLADQQGQERDHQKEDSKPKKTAPPSNAGHGSMQVPKQPRFSKGIISIKYKRSPIRLVSPPILKKVTGDSGSQSIVALQPTSTKSELEEDKTADQPQPQQRYFKEPKKSVKLTIGGSESEYGGS